MAQTIEEMGLPRVVPGNAEASAEMEEADAIGHTVATQTDADGACPTCGYVWESNILVEKGNSNMLQYSTF